MGLGRRIPETHDSLAWLVTHAAATIASTVWTIGCPGWMAITAGTTAQEHPDERRARIEQKVLEDVTGEGAMRLERQSGENLQGLMMKRQSRRGDGGGSKESHSSCSIWWFQFVVGGETRAFAAQEAEEQLGGDVVRASCRILRVLCVQKRRRGYSLVKSSRPLWIQSVSMSKELGALHVAESDVGERVAALSPDLWPNDCFSVRFERDSRRIVFVILFSLSTVQQICHVIPRLTIATHPIHAQNLTIWSHSTAQVPRSCLASTCSDVPS